MKVKELITILQACNPESEVSCDWRGEKQSDKDYRMACSWLVINDKTSNGKGVDALDKFSITGVKLHGTGKKDLEGLACTLTIDQEYFNKLFIRDTAKELKEKENDE